MINLNGVFMTASVHLIKTGFKTMICYSDIAYCISRVAREPAIGSLETAFPDA